MRTLTALMLSGLALVAQADPHAGHAQEKPAVGTAASPKRPDLPADAEGAKAALAASPRHGEWVDIALKDGPKLATWVVYPERRDKAPVVIVIHEIFGLTDWVRAVADQLAQEGFIALAPDLLSGLGPNGGGTEALGDQVGRVIRTLTPDQVALRLDAVRAYGLQLPAAAPKVGVVGYCWGGSASFNYAVAQPALGAAVVYYGSAPQDPKDLARIQAPLLGCFGADDARVNATLPAAEAALKARGAAFSFRLYEGAGHGFLRQQSGREGANRRAAEAAWKETVAFLRARLK